MGDTANEPPRLLPGQSIDIESPSTELDERLRNLLAEEGLLYILGARPSTARQVPVPGELELFVHASAAITREQLGHMLLEIARGILNRPGA